MISIIDYGLGNVLSVKNVFKKVGYKSQLIKTPEEILAAEKLVLPGVGHFKKGMENLIELKLVSPLTQRVLKDKVPLLGICLGMQLLTNHSEEGNINGLGFIDAKTTKLSNESSLKIPHMGWNKISVLKDSHLFKKGEINRFYFVHSYFVTCNDKSDILTTTNYGKEFCSGFSRKNIFGFQFHPEKSHKFGFRLMERFAKL